MVVKISWMIYGLKLNIRSRIRIRIIFCIFQGENKRKLLLPWHCQCVPSHLLQDNHNQNHIYINVYTVTIMLFVGWYLLQCPLLRMLFLLPWVLLRLCHHFLTRMPLFHCHPLYGITPGITTTIPSHLFFLQTGDIDTNCSFDDDCKEGKTIRTIKEPPTLDKRPTQECWICKVSLCKITKLFSMLDDIIVEYRLSSY